MKLEVGKTYLHYDDTIVHVAGRMPDGRLFGWQRHVGDDRRCTPSIYSDEIPNVSEYTPSKKVKVFLNVYLNLMREPQACVHPSFEAADKARFSDGATLEVTYCEDGTATVKVFQP